MITAHRASVQWGGAFIIGAFALDQATKALAVASKEALVAGIEVFPFFTLVFLRNTGVSFGIFSGHGQWPVISFTVTVVAAMAIWLIRMTDPRQAAAIGAVIGGALGNIIDRFRRGGVTDFLDFHYSGYHWPAFNLADAAIFLGAATLVMTRDDKPHSDRRAVRNSN